MRLTDFFLSPQNVSPLRERCCATRACCFWTRLRPHWTRTRRRLSRKRWTRRRKGGRRSPLRIDCRPSRTPTACECRFRVLRSRTERRYVRTLTCYFLTATSSRTVRSARRGRTTSCLRCAGVITNTCSSKHSVRSNEWTCPLSPRSVLLSSCRFCMHTTLSVSNVDPPTHPRTHDRAQLYRPHWLSFFYDLDASHNFCCLNRLFLSSFVPSQAAAFFDKYFHPSSLIPSSFEISQSSVGSSSSQ